MTMLQSGNEHSKFAIRTLKLIYRLNKKGQPQRAIYYTDQQIRENGHTPQFRENGHTPQFRERNAISLGRKLLGREKSY